MPRPKIAAVILAFAILSLLALSLAAAGQDAKPAPEAGDRGTGLRPGVLSTTAPKGGATTPGAGVNPGVTTTNPAGITIPPPAAGDLAAEPEWWTKKADYVKTADKLLRDYQNLPDYVAAMKKVHAKFTGKPGTLAMFGASQTAAREFWSPLSDKTVQKNMPPQMQKDYDLVNSYMKPECWKWKGGSNGNSGGMTTRWVRDTACGAVLKKLNPEVVVILIGQSDGMDMMLKPPHEEQFADWERGLTEACLKCLDNGSIVVMCTFPPRASRRADVFNEVILKIAATLKTPVADWGGECMKRSPTDWNGAAPEARAKYHYDPADKNRILDVPTLICFDGQHASYPVKYANDWSEESLKCSGNNLRTYVTLSVYADVLRKVIGVPQPPPDPRMPPPPPDGPASRVSGRLGRRQTRLRSTVWRMPPLR